MPRSKHQDGWVEETGKQTRKWVGYYYAYEDGKRLQRSKVLGPRARMTKGKAEDALREIIRRSEHGPVHLGVIKTFTDAVAQYQNLKRGDWCPNFQRNMASIFRNNVLPHLGKYAPKDITPSLLKNWITDQAERMSSSIFNKALTHVRAIFDMMIDDDMLAKNPARKVAMPKAARKRKRFLEIAEFQRLLGELKGQDQLMLEVFLCCGLRPSELFALANDDILPGKLRINKAYIPGEGVKDTKTDASAAMVPISDRLEARLRLHAAGRTGLLFPSSTGTPYDRANWLNKHLRPAAVRAKVPNVTQQCLRRTVATHLQMLGTTKDAQSILRHANATTTLNYYIQELDASTVRAAKALDLVVHSDGELIGSSLDKTF